jgi:hypothetical protein
MEEGMSAVTRSPFVFSFLALLPVSFVSLALVLVPHDAHADSGCASPYVGITGSSVSQAGVPLDGRICFVPVDAQGTLVESTVTLPSPSCSARIAERCVPVVGGSFAVDGVADPTLPGMPAFSYLVAETATAGDSILGPAPGTRTLVRPGAQSSWCAGGTCDFDALVGALPSSYVPQPIAGPGLSSAIAANPPAARTWQGAPEQKATDFPGSDIGAQVNAACASFGGALGIVDIPAGKYTLTTQIRPPSRCWIRGKGTHRTVLNANPGGNPNTGGLGVQQVFHVGDPSGASTVQNVRISNLAVTNGIPDPAGPWTGMDGIRADGCDGCTFDHLYIHSIQGAYGIVFKRSNDIYVADNVVTQFDMTGIMALSGSSNVWIQRNYVDTAMVQTNVAGNAYGIGIGDHEDVFLYDPFTDEGNVLNNEVRNIPSWECYDSHGGTNETFDGNFGQNCYFGMQLGTVTNDPLKYDVLSSAAVTNNYVDRGNGKPNGYGIVLAGSGTARLVRGALVQGNAVRGYGDTPCATGQGTGCPPNQDASVGAITIYSTVDSRVLGNRIPTYYQAAITLGAQNWNAAVVGNWAGDSLGAAPGAASTMIFFTSIGNWGTLVDSNAMGPSSAAAAPATFLVNQYQANEISLGPNNSAALYASLSSAFSGLLPVWWAQPYGLLNYQPNDVGYDPYPQLAYTFVVTGEAGYSAASTVGAGGADGSKSYYSKDTTDVIAVGTIAAGAVAVTGLSGNADICGSADYWYYCLPPGMHVTIAPATGTGGAPFAAKIVGNDGTQLTLDTPAPGDMTGATITYRDGAAGN